MSSPKTFLPLAALCTLGSFAAAQTTVTLPCVLDNTLYDSPTGSLSNAQGMGLFVGVTGQQARRRTLVQFDVSGGVPAGARILDAHLSVTVSRTAVPFNVDVFVHRALASWGEGTSDAPGQEGGGIASTPNDATWIHRFYPNTLWATPGGDFSPTVSAVIDTPNIGLATSATAQGLIDDVQSMLDNPAQNFGWLLKTNEAQAYVTRRLDSSESLGSPPALTVTYIQPGQTASWGTGCLVNNQPFTLALNGTASGGNQLTLAQSQGPANAVAVNLLALDLDRVGFPLLPQCNLYLPQVGPIVTFNLLLLDGSGNGATSWTVPSGFPGVMITSQSAALTSGNSYVLSNAAAALLQ
ncbi:MAG: DNRLRE domain-containing protein [Planctomycetes bacterium]|nr:DNRLRE domain-containing protein [Planctomycetota bacterium]MCB9884491.1 DNRLRE domain-containing protein [Planctomycetota bacterium]